MSIVIERETVTSSEVDLKNILNPANEEGGWGILLKKRSYGNPCFNSIYGCHSEYTYQTLARFLERSNSDLKNQFELVAAGGGNAILKRGDKDKMEKLCKTICYTICTCVFVATVIEIDN